MATFKIYPNGVTFGTGNATPPKNQRGTVRGWSESAARRNVQFLYSVQTEKLDGYGYAVTLTVRDCPESAADFHAARRAWIERLRRAGMIRLHWVMEWQRRGVPHLHAAVYMSEPLPREGLELTMFWQDVARNRGWTASYQSQDAKPITGAVGWLQYLSKHAGRSKSHYQRQGMPDGWKSSGRVWGYVGSWATTSFEPITLDGRETARVRRLMDGYLRAKARAEGDTARLTYLRRRRKAVTDPLRSRVLGVSEWIPEEVTLALLELATPTR